MDAFPSLKEDFERAKKKAVELGYIEMDKHVQRRWFDKKFDQMNFLSRKAWSYYPENYSRLSKEQKELAKIEINKQNPGLKAIWSEYFSMQGKLQRNSLNYRIQSLAGSQTKMAAILFRRYQIENNLQDKMWISSLIHDEVLAESNVDCSEECKGIIEKTMEDGGNTYCEKVKMKAQAHIVSFWHH